MKKFITFNTRSQALNYIKRYKCYNYYEGCGCCFHQENLFIDGNKVVLSYVTSRAGSISAEATVIGKVKSCR